MVDCALALCFDLDLACVPISEDGWIPLALTVVHHESLTRMDIIDGLFISWDRCGRVSTSYISKLLPRYMGCLTELESAIPGFDLCVKKK